MEDRKATLLKACLDIFNKQDELGYPMSEMAYYDGTYCDVLRLMDDIKTELYAED